MSWFNLEISSSMPNWGRPTRSCLLASLPTSRVGHGLPYGKTQKPMHTQILDEIRMGMSHTKWDHSIYIVLFPWRKVFISMRISKNKWHQKTDKLLWPPEFRCASKWCVGSPVTATYHDLESVVPAHVSLQSLGNAQGLQSNLEILRPVWPIQPPRVSL